MELGIGLGQSLHDLACFGNGRLCHGNRLEAALQGCILLDICPGFGNGCGADVLNFSRAASFSIYFRYSAKVVAPMT